MPLETSLFTLSSTFINHRHCRGGPEWGQVRQCGAWETPCFSPKYEALIKLLGTTPQHLTPSTQMECTQASVATHYSPKVCGWIGVRDGEWVCVCVCGGVTIKHSDTFNSHQAKTLIWIHPINLNDAHTVAATEQLCRNEWGQGDKFPAEGHCKKQWQLFTERGGCVGVCVVGGITHLNLHFLQTLEAIARVRFGLMTGRKGKRQPE